MERIKNLSMVFIAVFAAMLVGGFVFHLGISSGWKMAITYLASCVIVYVLFTVSGIAKHEELEHCDGD